MLRLNINLCTGSHGFMLRSVTRVKIELNIFCYRNHGPLAYVALLSSSFDQPRVATGRGSTRVIELLGLLSVEPCLVSSQRL